MKSRNVITSAAALLATAGMAQAQFTEGFTDITTLPGSGWFTQNNSVPGTTNWFQGNDVVFPAFAGAPTAYIAANFNNTSGLNTISNWLVTPVVPLSNGATLTFYTRTVPSPAFPDRLQVRMNKNNTGTNVGTTALDVGDFTDLLLDINPTYTTAGYPNTWTQQVATVTGVTGTVNGRLAFRYFVENAGPSGANSDYIGIDEAEYAVIGVATGRCCFADGSCTVVTAASCATAGGTYGGDNTNCTPNVCPQPATGRCCFSNGSCLVLTSSQCTTAGGTYGGNNTVCSTGACAQQPGNISCNGPFVTTPTGTCLPTGSLASEVQAGNTVAGFNQNGAGTAPFRIADDFTVPAGETWTVNGFTLYGYQTGAGVPTSTFTGATCRIWNGRPGDVGSTVVAGDDTTNVLTSSVFSNTYRYFNATCGTTRPIFANTVTLATPAVLTPGTYWVDFNSTGSLASGPWALPVTVVGLNSPPGANGRQFVSPATWQDLLDGTRVQEAAFCVRGSVATAGCYANCDGSSGNPLLTANDFQCFLNKYAANDTYANCDGSTGNPLLTANDFQCFLNKYAAGCS